MSAKRARKSANLVNSTDFTIVGFINEDGSIYYANSYRTTAHGISVTPGEDYTIAFDNVQSGGWYLVFAWYNEFGTLTYERYTLNISQTRYEKTVTAPADATILKISMVTVNINGDIMLNEGSIVRPYEPYGIIWELCAVKRYHNNAWIDAEEYVRHNGVWDEQ